MKKNTAVAVNTLNTKSNTQTVTNNPLEKRNYISKSEYMLDKEINMKDFILKNSDNTYTMKLVYQLASLGIISPTDCNILQEKFS